MFTNTFALKDLHYMGGHNTQWSQLYNTLPMYRLQNCDRLELWPPEYY